MLMMTSIIRVGQSKFVTVPIDEDSQERIMNCIRVLSEMPLNKAINEIFLLDTKAAYAKMVATEERKAREKREKESKTTAVQVDDILSFRQFSKKGGMDAADDVCNISITSYSNSHFKQKPSMNWTLQGLPAPQTSLKIMPLNLQVSCN
jgi:vesicle coat complex subunit